MGVTAVQYGLGTFNSGHLCNVSYYSDLFPLQSQETLRCLRQRYTVTNPFSGLLLGDHLVTMGFV